MLKTGGEREKKRKCSIIIFFLRIELAEWVVLVNKRQTDRASHDQDVTISKRKVREVRSENMLISRKAYCGGRWKIGRMAHQVEKGWVNNQPLVLFRITMVLNLHRYSSYHSHCSTRKRMQLNSFTE